MVPLIALLFLLQGEPKEALADPITSDRIITEEEAARVVGTVISGMQQTGDIRTLDRRLFSQEFFDVPCSESIVLIRAALCADLAPDERRDYAYLPINLIWGVLEHQLSLQDAFPPQDEVDAMFPEEVRHLVQMTRRSDPNSLEEFKKAMPPSRELEKALLEHHFRHDHLHQPSFETNRAFLHDKSFSTGAF